MQILWLKQITNKFTIKNSLQNEQDTPYLI